MTSIRAAAAAALLTVASVALAGAQELDTIPGGFDTGKMWTFEYAPAEHFTSTYGFRADQAWFDRIRLSVLRIPGCSASFVSQNGLVATNHHCIRGTLPSVQRAGESLLDEGFWAATAADERRIPGYYADRLIGVEDVTARVFAVLDTTTSADGRQNALRVTTATVQQELIARHGGGASLRVELIALYNGGRYSAYVFRRLDDVRLVGAVELQAGFFGGDPDNYTYPRYALDFAFLRVYDEQGRPFRPEQFLGWGSDGVQAGDPVFVVGNPGPTSRQNTLAQLELTRDVTAPITVDAFTSRLDAMRAFYAADPVRGEALDLRNQMFGLSNSLKAWEGRLAALRDPAILARKRAFERTFVDSIRDERALQQRYGTLIDSIALLQRDRRALADRQGAFLMLQNGGAGSRTLIRALAVASMRAAAEAGVSADSLTTLRNRIVAMPDRPTELERALLAAQITDLRRYLGAQASGLPGVGTNAEASARELMRGSVFGDSVRTATALAGGAVPDSDPGLRLALALRPIVVAYQAEAGRVGAAERGLVERLGRARFEVYGTRIAPDATFSPRITDGIVSGYPANGTTMPAFTTFFGMYDRHYSNPGNPEWALPERFLPIPDELDLDSPLNFASTADTYGGNSGSPAITPEGELVGLNFDRNIEGMSRDFIYLNERGRNVMVDSRAILEALDDIYQADRIVAELLTGRLDVPAAEAERLRQ